MDNYKIYKKYQQFKLNANTKHGEITDWYKGELGLTSDRFYRQIIKPEQTKEVERRKAYKKVEAFVRKNKGDDCADCIRDKFLCS